MPDEHVCIVFRDILSNQQMSHIEWTYSQPAANFKWEVCAQAPTTWQMGCLLRVWSVHRITLSLECVNTALLYFKNVKALSVLSVFLKCFCTETRHMEKTEGRFHILALLVSNCTHFTLQGGKATDYKTTDSVLWLLWWCKELFVKAKIQKMRLNSNMKCKLE